MVQNFMSTLRSSYKHILIHHLTWAPFAYFSPADKVLRKSEKQIPHLPLDRSEKGNIFLV